MIWQFHHRAMDAERLGIIPSFFDDADPRPAAEQLNERYAHGGGWRPQDGFSIGIDGALEAKGMPRLRLLASAFLGEELICYHNYSYLVIHQPDGSFEVGRVD